MSLTDLGDVYDMRDNLGVICNGARHCHALFVEGKDDVINWEQLGGGRGGDSSGAAVEGGGRRRQGSVALV
jgi:hypothetical protein